ncbi:MAG: glycosyltransferase [Anaerolineae bacterium]
MKVLLLTPQRPYPPHQGTTMRNFYLVAELAKRHDVSVLSFLEPDQVPDHGPLAGLCRWIETLPAPRRTTGRRLQQLLASTRPDMSWRLWSPDFQRRLAARLAAETFDVVQIEAIEMSPYLSTIEAARAANRRPLIIYDAHNAEWILQKRAFTTDWRLPRRWPAAAYSFVQWRRLRRYEGDVCRRCDAVFAVSEADREALLALEPELEATIIPNGVDLKSHLRFEGPRKAFDLVFTGKMDFRPNVDAMLWFGREILPRVQAERPATSLAVVGQRPHPRLEALRSLPGVTITGWVEDVRPYIAGAAVYVAPLRMGGGTRLKLLQAMAMGKAIVSTTVGAEGFAIAPGRELCLADAPASFAAAVLALLRDPARRLALGEAARQFVTARFGWEALVPQMEAVYERLKDERCA